MPTRIEALYQQDFPPEEFAARWDSLFREIGNNAAAIIQGAGLSGRSERFRQTNELYYLCGIEAPHCYLLLDGRTRKARLLLPHRDERHERSEGPSPSAEDEAEIRKLSGVHAVLPLEDLEKCIPSAGVLYTPFSPAEGAASYRDELQFAARRAAQDPWDAAPTRELRFQDALSAHRIHLQIRDLSPVLDRMRLIKSSRELVLMREAGWLTAMAVTAAMLATRPGLREFELGALARYIFQGNGAQGEGYRPIIACGKNIWLGHYYRCGSTLAAGEVVLMDYAPDYHYYTSDIGRTWPVNGRFTTVQRELYGFVTQYHKVVLRTIRPGKTPAEILAEAAEEMAPVVESTQFSCADYARAARKALDFTGHLSHPVGMAVHDVGSYWDEPLRPGLVISVDPQIWIPEQELYVRVEDTIAVTEEGIENLTALAPLDLDEIEAIVGTGDR